MPLSGCVIHCSLTWQRCALDSLVLMLGATYSPTLDETCTHVLTARAGSHRHHVAKVAYPDVHVLHPKWLWACFWSRQRAAESKYDIDFFTDTLRSGTSTAYGTKEQFDLELPLLRLAERRVQSKEHTSRSLKQLLMTDDFDTVSPNWSFVSQVLQHTLFWSPRIRARNWNRRRVILMCLLRQQRRLFRAAKRDSPTLQKGGVLHRVACLPCELWRQVITFL